MFELKPISRDAIPEALAKVERYRLLNEPWQAESICRDVLAIDPANQTAIILLVLSPADQFDHLLFGDHSRTPGNRRVSTPRLAFSSTGL